MAASSNKKHDWLVIVNPAAGNGKTRQKWPPLRDRLKGKGLQFETAITDRKGHATELVIEGVRAGFRQFLVVGGDGTHHEAVNGIFRQKQVSAEEITYALLPVGSGNDWARTYGIPRKWSAWWSMMEAGRTVLQDVGVTWYEPGRHNTGTYFANVAGMGYDAYLVKRLEKPGAKRNALQYFSMIFRCLFDYRLQRARVEIDGHTVEGRFYTVHAGICKYSGGGMSFVPHANPFDGQLAVTLIGEITKLGVIVNTYRLYTGSIHRHGKVQTFQAKSVEVTSLEDDPIGLEADGEWLGGTPVRLEVAKEKLRAIVPCRTP